MVFRAVSAVFLTSEKCAFHHINRFCPISFHIVAEARFDSVAACIQDADRGTDTGSDADTGSGADTDAGTDAGRESDTGRGSA